MNWKLSPALVTLRRQYNDLYPNRSKASDGTIADNKHSATSDHQPNKNGVVTALDITHDPEGGLDIAKEAEKLAKSRDPRIKYIIRNHEILEPSRGWVWRKYSGTNPHTKHMHISVNANNYDDAREWKLTNEEEPMFNEGDRQNFNYHFYGKDLGLHKELVGKKTFKAAITDIWDYSKEFKHHAKVNNGDTINYFLAIVGRKPTDGELQEYLGSTHKNAIYKINDRPDVKARLGSIGAVNVVEVPEGTLIKVKGE